MPALFRFAQLLALLTVVFVLSACGGGGSSDKVAATHAVSATSGAGGTISPASRNVAHGATATFEVTPQSGYSIDAVSGCNGTIDGGTYTTGAITGACTVGATFAINRYTVNSIAGTGGSISPATQLVNHGATAGFTVTPESGYDIETVTGCNGALVGNTYRTGAITGACTVSATFAVKIETTKFTVEGRVLNGVLVGSTVDVFGANGGSVLGTATTDADGRYSAEVSQDAPYRLRATGGKLNGVDYTGVLEASCSATSGCFVTPYTIVLLRLVDEYGFNMGDGAALLANSLGFDGDPFAEDVPAEDFDLSVARQAIAGGDGLAAWVASIVAWATEEGAARPPGVIDNEPAEPPLPPVDPGPVPPPAPDPDPEPVPDPAPVTSLLLFGGQDNSVYLGCLTCNAFDSESVCNSFGTYGSPFSSASIWNQFGTYGSPFATYSPWNAFSLSGPAIEGTDGLFYGYFTVNTFKVNRTTIQTFVDVLNFYSTSNDLSATRSYACGN